MALKKLMREPITQFILIGLALVAINHLWTSYQGEQGRTITVSSAEIERLEKIWANTAGRLPTGEDRQMIIDQFVQEEVLVREAERLGLGFEDAIIRRRLAQKMDFLVSEEAKPEDPSDSELRAWFDDNRDQFAASERRSFNHIYFSPERHGDAIETAAGKALNNLKTGADWQTLGDPFIQKRTYVTLPQSEVTRLFGNDFSNNIFKLKPGQWSTPIGSAFGLHLVKIETVDDAAEASFEPIKAEVLVAWQDQQAADSRRAAVEKLVDGYDVVVEGDARK